MGANDSKSTQEEGKSIVISQLADALRSANSTSITDIISRYNIDINQVVLNHNNIVMTPLMYAAAFEKFKLIPYLVKELGADVNREINGETVLTFSIMNNLSAGFYETLHLEETDINKITSTGLIPIVEASREGKDSVYFVGLFNKGASLTPLNNLPGNFRFSQESLKHLKNSNF